MQFCCQCITYQDNRQNCVRQSHQNTVSAHHRWQRVADISDLPHTGSVLGHSGTLWYLWHKSLLGQFTNSLVTKYKDYTIIIAMWCLTKS